jgi:hypothetical protein
MKPGYGIILVLAGVALGVIVAGIARGGEPKFQGRTLSAWIAQEEDIQFEANGDSMDCESDPQWRAATNAVYQIGTNAVPWLVKWANAKDSRPKAAVIKWINSHPWLHWHIQSEGDRKYKAMIGLFLLKDKAPGENRTSTEKKSPEI